MKINVSDDNAVTFSFPPSELPIAIQLMQAISSCADLPYVRDAIEECQKRIRPRLTLVSHFHYCTHCIGEIDDRVGDNFIHMTTDTKDYWAHKECPVIKVHE